MAAMVAREMRPMGHLQLAMDMDPRVTPLDQPLCVSVPCHQGAWFGLMALAVTMATMA